MGSGDGSMRIVRFCKGKEEPQFGWVFEDRIGIILGSPFGDFRRLEADIPYENVKLFTPVVPNKIIGVGSNFIHLDDDTYKPSENPVIHLKPPTSVIGPGDDIILPPQAGQVNHEAELAVVIGKKGRWIKNEQVKYHILGYTAANDVTAVDILVEDGQWGRGKSFDTFCPLGPWIETDFDFSDILMTCRVNDELRQMASTREFRFSIPELVVFVSSVMTLNPGDVILTGTPEGSGSIEEGDVVEVGIEGIGVLTNRVVREHFAV